MSTKTNVNTKLAVLPWFPGFYESVLDGMIDSEIEMEMEGGGEDRPAKTWEEVDKVANYAAARLAITQEWVKAFAAETGLEMEFESLDSPREYNFTTDRAFVHLPAFTLEKLEAARNSPEFAAILTEWFTSYDGFFSSYSPEIENKEWQKPLADWDHNQLSALIAGYVSMSGEDCESLTDTLCNKSRVYEAAHHVWDAK